MSYQAMRESKSSYPDLVVNAFKSVQAWKSVALILVGIVIFETIALGYMASQRTILLIPQHLPATKGPISLNLGEPFSPDYLTAIAKGDLYALLNWTPDNIEQQYGLFTARLAPNLSDSQRESLLNEAKLHKEEGLSQSFYVTRTFVKDGAVTAAGILVRSTGGREIFRGQVAYELGYLNAGNGMLLINSVRQPTDGAPASK